jgi:hypothetical protein
MVEEIATTTVACLTTFSLPEFYNAMYITWSHTE